MIAFASIAPRILQHPQSKVDRLPAGIHDDTDFKINHHGARSAYRQNRGEQLSFTTGLPRCASPRTTAALDFGQSFSIAVIG
jgi:hypothetical protein